MNRVKYVVVGNTNVASFPDYHSCANFPVSLRMNEVKAKNPFALKSTFVGEI